MDSMGTFLDSFMHDILYGNGSSLSNKVTQNAEKASKLKFGGTDSAASQALSSMYSPTPALDYDPITGKPKLSSTAYWQKSDVSRPGEGAFSLYAVPTALSGKDPFGTGYAYLKLGAGQDLTPDMQASIISALSKWDGKNLNALPNSLINPYSQEQQGPGVDSNMGAQAKIDKAQSQYAPSGG